MQGNKYFVLTCHKHLLRYKKAHTTLVFFLFNPEVILAFRLLNSLLSEFTFFLNTHSTDINQGYKVTDTKISPPNRSGYFLVWKFKYLISFVL